MTARRRLTAILAADVAGYSRLMGADEEGTHERLKAHLGELVEPKIKEHRGRIVKNTGDGFLAEFASVVDAVRCAVEAEDNLKPRSTGVLCRSLRYELRSMQWRGGHMLAKIACATVLGLSLLASGAARADGGGGGGGGSDRQTCPGGYVYDARTNSCVKQQAGVLPDPELTDYAFALIKTGRYGDAIGVLDILENPNTAVALNYRGYATRKLGRVDEGIGYYLKSVALDPHYAQVREYLGEAYLVKGDIASAKAELQAIKRICGTTCEAYEHLAVAMADPADL